MSQDYTPFNDPTFEINGEQVLAALKLDADTLLKNKQFEKDEEESLIIVKPANTWIQEAAKTPVPRSLLGELWFEGELAIGFSDTNMGKSILSVQAGDSISRGVGIDGLHLESSKQRVLYCDFELTAKQFENRYSNNYNDHYLFDSNFLRAELNPSAPLPNGFENFEDYLIYCIEQFIQNQDMKVIIIDNVTYLGQETEKARNALYLMKKLNLLKKQYGLSILVLAHTPKIHDPKPLSHNHIQGSKMFSNFCDASFGIGKCQSDENMRYIKQVKARSTEIVYGSDNVILCEIRKPHNFLHFQILGYGKEWEVLKTPESETIEDRIGNAKRLKGEGRTQREIAQILEVSLGTVNKYLKS